MSSWLFLPPPTPTTRSPSIPSAVSLCWPERFKIGISRNTKCDKSVDFPKSSHNYECTSHHLADILDYTKEMITSILVLYQLIRSQSETANY